MKTGLWIATALTISSPCWADTASDIARLRSLLVPGTDIAQVQASLLYDQSEAEAMEAGKSNYVLADLNGDGLQDALLISEDQPTPYNFADDKPCTSLKEENCMVKYGPRHLELFLGQRDGSLRRDFRNSGLVFAGDEGGVFGDPLQGLTLRGNGSVTLSVYGGSSWRWGYTDTFQFRNGKLVVIGQDSSYGWTGDGREDTRSVNLITGRVVETSRKDMESPVKKKVSRIKVKPLEAVANYKGQAER
jgi:hypothetical protein